MKWISWHRNAATLVIKQWNGNQQNNVKHGQNKCHQSSDSTNIRIRSRGKSQPHNRYSETVIEELKASKPLKANNDRCKNRINQIRQCSSAEKSRHECEQNLWDIQGAPRKKAEFSIHHWQIDFESFPVNFLKSEVTLAALPARKASRWHITSISTTASE